MLSSSEQIPIRTLVVPTSIALDCFLSKSATKLVAGNERTRVILGFAADEDESLAANRSRWEVYERFWATYPFALGLPPDADVDAYVWPSGKRKAVKAKDILLRFIDESVSSDATGLAFGESFRDAFMRSILEVCERHLLASIWYKKSMVLSTTKSISLREDAFLSFYCSAQYGGIPLVIAVLDYPSKDLWVCGSALCLNYLQAEKKAKFEALMIAESLLSESFPFYSKESARKRYWSLKGPLSKQRKSYFYSLIAGKSDNIAQCIDNNDANNLIKILLGDDSELLVSVIHKNRNEYVVRALSTYALSPAKERSGVSDESIPLDPFC